MDATNGHALDVIAAFAVPSPGFQRLESGFFGFGRPGSHPSRRITQPTSDLPRFVWQPFRPSTNSFNYILANNAVTSHTAMIDPRHHYFDVLTVTAMGHRAVLEEDWLHLGPGDCCGTG